MEMRLLTSKNGYSYIKTHKLQFHSDIWVNDRNLTLMDKAELKNDTVLSDKHIAAAQMLLEKSFPHIKGFQATLLHSTFDSHSVNKDINGKNVRH